MTEECGCNPLFEGESGGGKIEMTRRSLHALRLVEMTRGGDEISPRRSR